MTLPLYIQKSSSTPKAKAKGPSAESKSKPKGNIGGVVGEQRGGTYVARLQVGYSKGKPRYRYFKTVEELERYRKWKNGDKAAVKQHKERNKRGDKLDNKKMQEDEKSKGKARTGVGKILSGPKIVATEREREDSELTKSLHTLFIWRF